jgi:hypothetical protein
MPVIRAFFVVCMFVVFQVGLKAHRFGRGAGQDSSDHVAVQYSAL